MMNDSNGFVAGPQSNPTVPGTLEITRFVLEIANEGTGFDTVTPPLDYLGAIP